MPVAAAPFKLAPAKVNVPDKADTLTVPALPLVLPSLEVAPETSIVAPGAIVTLPASATKEICPAGAAALVTVNDLIAPAAFVTEPLPSTTSPVLARNSTIPAGRLIVPF